MMFRIALLLVFIVAVQSRCDNLCSGHGTCDINDVCSCYDNWGVGLSHDSGDCSDRVCPFEIAWVDTPDKYGRRHKYAECAGAGICDRTTGECNCFPGYEGRGCARMSCPNSCSGHGVCQYIDEMPFQAVYDDYSGNTKTFLYQEAYNGFKYYGWDKQKTTGCVCDPGYGDTDCSKQMCPYATDVLAVRQNLLVQGKNQIQTIKFRADSVSGVIQPITALNNMAFALTFKSKLNETFTTRPIIMPAWSASSTNTVQATALAAAVKTELKLLPTNVIDDVVVSVPAIYCGTTCTAVANQIYATYDATFTLNLYGIDLAVEFNGNNVQGPQHFLTAKVYHCAAGCTPLISTAMDLMPQTQTVTETQSSEYNSYECGRRGKCDYTTGICTCFSGYTGASCNQITALV